MTYANGNSYEGEYKNEYAFHVTNLYVEQFNIFDPLQCDNYLAYH